MEREYRLKKRASFNYIYRKGDSVSTPLMILYTIPARTLKIGISVGKKVGNSVVRNRVKRRIKERFRLLIPEIKKEKNYIAVARARCAECDGKKINEDLIYLLKKSDSLKTAGATKK